MRGMLEPMNVILYPNFVEHSSNCVYPGTVMTVPYELSALLRVNS